MVKKIILSALVIVVLVFAVLAAVRYYNKYRFHLEKQTRFMMDTFVSVYAIGPKKVTPEAINGCLDRMQEIDNKFNTQNKFSPIWKFNHENVPITDPEILYVIKQAMEIAQKTDGALDITISPLIELWGFYGEQPRVPEEERIRACLEKTGYNHLRIGPEGLGKDDPEVRIDLGAIAKGYAISEGAKVLKNQGVSSALIDAGGDIHALGSRAGKPWKVGIRSPRDKELLGYLEVTDTSVMGSGDYERFFMENNVRYHHIFNPKTGYPARGMSGITLIYPDATLADGWNTALFVLGPEKALEFVETMEGMEVIIVTDSGDIRFSSGTKNALNAVSSKSNQKN